MYHKTWTLFESYTRDASFFHHRSGGRWEKLKSERSCAKLRFDFVLAVWKRREEGVTDNYNVVEKSEFSWRLSISLFQLLSCSTWQSVGWERVIFMAHMLWFQIGRERGRERGDEKRCRISICCANITKAHAYMGYPRSAKVAPKIAAKTRQESIAMDVNSDHV